MNSPWEGEGDIVCQGLITFIEWIVCILLHRMYYIDITLVNARCVKVKT